MLGGPVETSAYADGLLELTGPARLLLDLMQEFLLEHAHSRQSKVPNFDLVVLSQEYVRWLQVSMDDLLRVNVSQPLEDPPDYLDLYLLLLESRTDELPQVNPPAELHHDVQHLERKPSFLTFLRRHRLRILHLRERGQVPVGIPRDRPAGLLELDLAVTLKLDPIVFLEHDVIVLLLNHKLLLFVCGFSLEMNAPPRLDPFLVHMLEAFFFLRFHNRQIMEQLLLAANVLQPALVVSHYIRMVQCRQQCHLI